MVDGMERISVSVSKENLLWLDANYNNRSAFINDLLTNAREGNGQVDSAIREYQIQQLESELAGMKSQVETKAARLESLKAEQRSDELEKERLWEEAKDALEEVPKEPDNPAVKNWAGKLELTPTELIEELEE